MLDEHDHLPTVLPVVLYNGAAPWKAAVEVGALLQPVGGALAPYRPSQRHHLLDERHIGQDDLPWPNLVMVLIRLEQSSSQWDLIPVRGMLRECLPGPEDDALREVFVDWMRQILQRVAPGGEQIPAKMTLEEMHMTLVERALLRRQAASRFGADTARGLWPKRWTASRTRSARPTWGSGWCVARRGRSFSPESLRQGPRVAEVSPERSGLGYDTSAGGNVFLSSKRERPLVDLQRLLVDTLLGELRLRSPPALGAHCGAAGRVV